MSEVLQLAEYLLTASLVFVVLALICNVVIITSRQRRAAVQTSERVTVAAGVPSSDTLVVSPVPDRSRRRRRRAPLSGLAWYATGFAAIAFVCVLAYVLLRMSLTGHGPFSNQHEFAVSFVLGILGAYLVVEFVYQVRALSLAVLPIAAVLLLYAMSLDAGVQPLIPALQNNLLLTLHVGFAILAYGAAAVSCGAAALYLLHPKLRLRNLPARDLFDDIG